MSVRFPQVEFNIGKKSLSIPPNHITSFIFEDTIAMAGDAFTLEFFDPTWEILDSDLIPSMAASVDKQVSFRFGWGASEMSETHYGAVTEFTPGEINRSGVNVTLKGWDSISAKDGSQKKVEASYQGKISEVVNQIAVRNGWKADIEETIEVFELEGKDKGKQLKTWRQNAKTDLAFLNELAQRAKSSSKPGAYRVYFDSQLDPPVLHFHPDRASQYPIHREYEVGTSSLGEVISFSPTVEGAAVVALGASTTTLVYRDPNTRKLKEQNVAPETFPEGVALGSKSMIKGGVKVKQVVPPSSDAEAESRLGSYYEGLSWAVNKSSLEVVGDPYLLPGRLISVIVKTSTGKRYFTSGIYLIERVTHTITPGNYTSQLELIKNAYDVGDLPLAKGTSPATQGKSPGRVIRATREREN